MADIEQSMIKSLRKRLESLAKDDFGFLDKQKPLGSFNGPAAGTLALLWLLDKAILEPANKRVKENLDSIWDTSGANLSLLD